MRNLRILSLLPAATEIVYLLGLEKYLVGVSHECDWPPEAKKKSKVTFSEVSNSLASIEIDNKVRNLLHRGPGVFHIKGGVLKKLRPNLILTQELCKVCAVGFDQVRKAARFAREARRARILDSDAKIISLEPQSVEDILKNILSVGEYSGKSLESRKIVQNLRNRLQKLDSRFSILASKRPKVLAIEWLDPIMVAGHWVPEMVEIARGRNLISKPRERSKRVNLYQISQREVDILVISPCGFDIQRTIKEKELINKIFGAVRHVRVFLLDGNSYITRPGPRIVDGIEILAEILHPGIFPRKHTQKDWIKYE